jgi:hypothetical protein
MEIPQYEKICVYNKITEQVKCLEVRYVGAIWIISSIRCKKGRNHIILKKLYDVNRIHITVHVIITIYS